MEKVFCGCYDGITTCIIMVISQNHIHHCQCKDCLELVCVIVYILFVLLKQVIFLYSIGHTPIHGVLVPNFVVLAVEKD